MKFWCKPRYFRESSPHMGASGIANTPDRRFGWKSQSPRWRFVLNACAVEIG